MKKISNQNSDGTKKEKNTFLRLSNRACDDLRRKWWIILYFQIGGIIYLSQVSQRSIIESYDNLLSVKIFIPRISITIISQWYLSSPRRPNSENRNMKYTQELDRWRSFFHTTIREKYYFYRSTWFCVESISKSESTHKITSAIKLYRFKLWKYIDDMISFLGKGNFYTCISRICDNRMISWNFLDSFLDHFFCKIKSTHHDLIFRGRDICYCHRKRSIQDPKSLHLRRCALKDKVSIEEASYTEYEKNWPKKVSPIRKSIPQGKNELTE